MTDMNEAIARAFGAPDRAEEISELVDLVGGSDELTEALVKKTNDMMENTMAFAAFLNTGVRQLGELNDKLEEMDEGSIDIPTAMDGAEFAGFVKGMAFSFTLTTLGAQTVDMAIKLFGHENAIDKIASKGYQLANEFMMAHQMFQDVTEAEGVDGARDLIRLLKEHNGNIDAVATEKLAAQAEKFLGDTQE